MISIRFGSVEKTFPILNAPLPHIVVPCSKQVVHGWSTGYFTSKGRRECSSERVLLNPYNGCALNCMMCYARALRGYFELWDERNVVTVFENFDKIAGSELDKLHVASCGYLSPVTEPFQKPLENTYGLAEKTANAFLDRGLPIEFITKQGDNVPDRLLGRMAQHPHSFCQFTILSVNDNVRQVFSPKGADSETQFKAVRKAVDKGLFVVVRVDPLFPGITDDEKSVLELAQRAKDEGASHLIFSLCDIDVAHAEKIFDVVRNYFSDAYLLWKKIYVEKIGNDLNSSIHYRRKKFAQWRRICEKLGVTMSLCMEFEKVGDRYVGLNDAYMTSRVCEGKVIPIYVRKRLSELFKPLQNCDGNCLSYAKNRGTCNLACGFAKLGRAEALRFQDYKALHPTQKIL